MLARDFLVDELGQDAAQVLPLFAEVAETGRTHNSAKFSPERGEIHAFKTTIKNKLVRIPCFRISNRWLLLFGFFKKGAQKGRGKWRQEDLDKADNIRLEHMEVERLQREREQRQRNQRQR
jgi:hypothetical protein